MPVTNHQQALSEISEKDTNERPMREKMAKNTTGDMSVCVPLGPKAPSLPSTWQTLTGSCCWPHVHRWRSPPTAIYMAEARSPRALPTPSPKWTVLGRASPHRSAAVAATAKPVTAETVSVGEGREAGGAMGDEGTSPPDVVLCHVAMGRFVLLSLSHRSSSHACCRHSHLAAGMAMESTECNPCACTPISISR